MKGRFWAHMAAPGRVRRHALYIRCMSSDELHDLTGIAPTELVAFRPQRLVLHELLEPKGAVHKP